MRRFFALVLAMLTALTLTAGACAFAEGGGAVPRGHGMQLRAV